MISTTAHPLADPASYRALVHPPGTRRLEIIDQRALPHACTTIRLYDAEAAARAIRSMWIRGAPLIGAVGAYGLALALDADSSDAGLAMAHQALDATRPTAVNLRWALDRVAKAVSALPVDVRADAAWREADAIATEDVAINHAIGRHGLALLRELAAKRSGPIRVMTHCNAGALATCGWGTATAPLFLAHAEGIPLHVFVSETRPRLQGANLTAWEFRQRGIPHTLFVDGASGPSTSSSSAPIASRATATSATRSAPTTRRWPRRTTACRSTRRSLRRRSIPPSLPARRSRSRRGSPVKSSRSRVATSTATWRR
jgi:methylthioribose-1-phosphate isomerase